MNVPLGSVVGQYEIVELIGRGAMASVYRIRHRELNAVYALKVLEIARRDVQDRLINEGRVQASLRHPNVLGVNDVLEVGGHTALVLEYVDGPDLEVFIHRESPLPLDEIDAIARGILKGVRAAHRAGHLHRDLKPTNILLAWLDDGWVPKVADFGLAKVLHDDPRRVSSTRAGQVMGSPPFMSPEQCRDSSTVDERSDVFALGAVLYELATGKRAFHAPDIVSVFARIASGAFVPVDELRPDLPRRMVDAIHGALAVDREDRIPDVDRLLAVWSGSESFAVRPRDVTRSMVSLLGTAAPADERVFTIDRSRASSASIPALRVSVIGSFATLFAGAAALGGALLGGLVVLALMFVFSGPREPDEQVPFDRAPVPGPAAEPEPVVEPEPLADAEPGEPPRAPPPTPVAQPRPEPDARGRAPEAALRAPEPTVPVVPTPAPQTGDPPWGMTEPTPAPWAQAPGTGRFRVVGDASVRLLGAPGAFVPGDAVPPGEYFIEALFHGQPRAEILRRTHVEIVPGKAVVLTCDAARRVCVQSTE